MQENAQLCGARETEGLLVRGVGGLYEVVTETGRIRCRARGRLRLDGRRPLVGDRVRLCARTGDDWVLNSIEPRRNELFRPALANLDLLVLLASGAPPVTDLPLLDRVSVIAEHQGIETAVCVNKCDLSPGEVFWETYRLAGFPVLRVSARTGEGVDGLRALLRGRVCALTGNSGVGKSSLLARLDPTFPVEIGALSEKIGRGKQTTRHVELFALPEGGYVADTPGFSSFDVERMASLDVHKLPSAFREFRPYLENCRYAGCSHTGEQGCAVREAVESGAIPRSRYESYVRIYESLKDMKEWNRRNAPASS